MHKYDDFKKVRDELQADGFSIKEHMFFGRAVYLITPEHIGCTWTNDNLIYRSSVWDEYGRPVSLSWKKFFNFGEALHISPDPVDLKGAELLNKQDGSTLICSVFNNEWMIRTRGTIDATQLTNGYEIAFLKQKYARFFNDLVKCHIRDLKISVVFEWETPNNVIVLNNCIEPQLILTGIINHNDYSYWSQAQCDTYASIWKVERPIRYSYDSLDALIAGIKNASGIEGTCIYFDKGQTIKKLKSIEYLKLHAFKSNMSGSYRPICELIVHLGSSNIDVIKDHIVSTYDYECWDHIQDKMTKVVKLFDDLLLIIETTYFGIEGISDQKDFAIYVMSKYKDISAYLFQLRKTKASSINDLLSDERMQKKLASDLEYMCNKELNV